MQFPAARTLAALALLASTAEGSVVAQASAPAPTLHGRLAAANGASVAGLRVWARTGPFVDSAQVDSTGVFALRVAPGRGPVEVRAAGDPASPAFYPATARVRREDLGDAQGFVLVPRRWTIAQGPYAGQGVDVDLAGAFRGACGGCSGFFQFRGGRMTAARGRTLTWPAQRLPLRVAFDRDREGGPQLGAGDSAAFWSAAAALQATVGERLFRASSYPEALPADDAPGDVVLVRADPALREAGLTTVVSGEEGISYAAVRLHDAALIRDRGGEVVLHELLHSVGIGHTCSWPSVMAPLQCIGLRTPVPSAQDVAHVQLLLRVREMQRDPALPWGIEEALDAAGITRPAAPPVMRQASVREASEGAPPPPLPVRIVIPHGT